MGSKGREVTRVVGKADHLGSLRNYKDSDPYSEGSLWKVLGKSFGILDFFLKCTAKSFESP